jgi:hypothetical protein
MPIPDLTMRNNACLLICSLCWVLSAVSPCLGQEGPIELKLKGSELQARLRGMPKAAWAALDAQMPSTEEPIGREAISFDGKAAEIRKQLTYFGRRCEMRQRVAETSFGLVWDIEVRGEGDAWTVPLEVSLAWGQGEGLQFWTSWPDLQQSASEAWEDPFQCAALGDLQLVYGGADHYARNAFAIPVALICSPSGREPGWGLSLVRALSDTIFDLELHTSAAGRVAFRQENHRISSERPLRLRYYVVLHEPDWRAALGWVSDHFPEYFAPQTPLAKQVAGCGAYSSYEGELPVEKLRKMGFSLNWKASLDFPYMGMFIPPVKSDSELWPKYRQRGVVLGDGYASIERLAAYSARFKEQGFHTLSYFNVTEFGNAIRYPHRSPSEAPVPSWLDANEMLYRHFRPAMLKPAGVLPYWDERPLFSNWEDCVVLDPGDSSYRAFLMGQAELHVAKIPASAGICIDRLDWLRYYNGNADDQASMVQGQRTRFMGLSWQGLMAELGPMMHRHGKVIFCNPLCRRIDWMQHIDGIYDEYGNLATSLNLCAQLALRKPLIAWTASREDLMLDPDAYFQRHLYLGAFLTVPFPGNDHCILPDPEVEQYYLDYGPMLQALKGREWVLIPEVLKVVGGEAKANLFQVEDHWILPLVLAGAQREARVEPRLPPGWGDEGEMIVQVLHPGLAVWEEIPAAVRAGRLHLQVPLKRGCAMVRVEQE